MDSFITKENANSVIALAEDLSYPHSEGDNFLRFSLSPTNLLNRRVLDETGCDIDDDELFGNWFNYTVYIYKDKTVDIEVEMDGVNSENQIELFGNWFLDLDEGEQKLVFEAIRNEWDERSTDPFDNIFSQIKRKG